MAPGWGDGDALKSGMEQFRVIKFDFLLPYESFRCRFSAMELLDAIKGCLDERD